MPQSVESYAKAFQCKKSETPEECEARKEARIEQLVKEGKLVDTAAVTVEEPVVKK